MSPREIPTAPTTPSTHARPDAPTSSPLTPVVFDQAEPLTPAKKAPKDHRRDYKLHGTTRARTITASGLALPATRNQLQTRTIHSQVRFLREFARCGIILRAAQAAGVGRRIVSHWREDPAFEALMVEAHEDALDLLEEEARRRGADGVVEPVYQGGKEVGSIRKYSDHLLMMFLKGKGRADFSERVEQTGANGTTLAPAVVLVSWHHSMKPPEQP